MTPGTYITTYTVCVAEAPTECTTVTSTHTLTDPCSPPTSVTLADMTDQSYTLSDSTKNYPVSAASIVTVDPAYCPTIFSNVNIEALANGNKAVTVTNTPALLDFNIFYIADLTPVLPTPQTSTVTVTVETSSLYPTASTEKKTD